jgi:hypothetical protein
VTATQAPSHRQLGEIHRLIAVLSWDDLTYRDFLFVAFGVHSSKKLSRSQASAAIRSLKVAAKELPPDSGSLPADVINRWNGGFFSTAALGIKGLRGADAPDADLIKHVGALFYTFVGLNRRPGRRIGRPDLYCQEYIRRTIGTYRISTSAQARQVVTALYKSIRYLQEKSKRLCRGKSA